MLPKSSNTILLHTPQMPHHTDMARIFETFDGLQRQFHWLLSGDEQFFIDGRPMWLSGNELTDRVEGGWSCFGWGVFSGFAPHEVVDLSASRFPYADGNPALWKPYPSPQHPQATVEIVCFDSSLTLLLSREPEFTRRFRAAFSDARDLDSYIDEHVRPVLEAWADAERRLPVGAVVTVPVTGVGQTTASVELAPNVHGSLNVKQMRAAGFGPGHWFALCDRLSTGQQVTVRISSLDAEARIANVEFLRLA